MTAATVATHVVAASHSFAGALSWVSPDTSWRTFGLGRLAGTGADAPSARVISRLFGVRDVALGLGLRHPEPAVRRAVLQAGLAIDLVDVVASLRGFAQGAPRATLLGVTAGAALIAALEVVALSGDRA